MPYFMVWLHGFLLFKSVISPSTYAFHGGVRNLILICCLFGSSILGTLLCFAWCMWCDSDSCKMNFFRTLFAVSLCCHHFVRLFTKIWGVYIFVSFFWFPLMWTRDHLIVTREPCNQVLLILTLRSWLMLIDNLCTETCPSCYLITPI